MFHSNDDQGWTWGEKAKIGMKPKGKGCGLMVSDFIDEHNGFLALTEDEHTKDKIKYYPDLQREARAILKYGTEPEGYWNSDNF